MRKLLRFAGVAALLATACASPVPPTATLPAPTAAAVVGAAPTLAAVPAPTPPPRIEPTPTPTPILPWTPAGAPEYCVAPEKGEPQEVVSTPASPYFVRLPAEDNPNAPIIVFLEGGSGGRRSAQRVWTNYLSQGKGVDDFLIVLPYSADVDFYDYYEARRTYRVIDEVLACYGGDPAQVHLAGFSNGGHVAFDLILEHPERFATLLGAPGEFPQQTTPEQWAKALSGRAVFNGVGALDNDWKQGVRSAHEGLSKMGIDSVYVEFEGQGHSLNRAFDETVFFDFWRAHGPEKPANAAEGKWDC